MNREYSNSQIKLAGEILKNPVPYKEEDLQFAQSALNYWRSIHIQPINTFHTTLKQKLIRLELKNTITAQRLKRSVSIVDKLKRFQKMKLPTMQDIAGIRAIVQNVRQARLLERNYRETRFPHRLKDNKDYVGNPAISGYRGIHLVFQYNNQKYPESNGLKVELQIRSKLQHIWATAVETVGTFLDYSLKSSSGPENWLDYFRLVSSGFALLEKCPLLKQHSGLDEKEIFGRIVDQTNKLNVYERLKAFTIATEHITKAKKYSKYNLITLDLEEEFVNVTSYSANEFEKANFDYSDIENEIYLGAPLQTVLVSTGSIDSLQEAYPNFFLDSEEFIDTLNLIKSRLV